MGTQEVQSALSADQRRAFMKALLADTRALERMLAEGRLESGPCRVGVEQELVLVDAHWQPAPLAMQILADIEDPRVNTEIARFNLEINLPPLDLAGDCLSRLEAALHEAINLVRAVAQRHGAEVLLTGILPTLTMNHLGRENISDRPRYFALNDALSRLRGGPYELQIKGADELTVEHDSIMLEALNTSFQLHFQVPPDRFARCYNVAQLIAAPVLAVGCNSPILFAKRLWRETRIAIFQQTVDTRLDTPHERDLVGRVRFGEEWVRHGVMELFQQDIARFRVILGRDVDEDPMAALDRGQLPRLSALQLHNSTVYRWNRACYGLGASADPLGRASHNGTAAPFPTAHLRIENRFLPAGPSIVDEVANAAFWFGLMAAGPDAFGDVPARLDFDEARANFLSAANLGLAAELHWLDGRSITATELIRGELLQIAREGLRGANVSAAEIDRYLGIIAERARTRKTGAQWLLDSVAAMKGQGTRAERLMALTAATFHRQRENKPVHEWPVAQLKEAGAWQTCYQRIEQYMTTDLFTVHEDEVIDMVATLMDWERIRHVPVEDDKHNLRGLVSYRALLRLLAREGGIDRPIPVKEIMQCNPITCRPDTTTLDAVHLMREHKVACLPVVNETGRLVGLVTEHDFINIAAHLLEEHFQPR